MAENKYHVIVQLNGKELDGLEELDDLDEIAETLESHFAARAKEYQALAECYAEASSFAHSIHENKLNQNQGLHQSFGDLQISIWQADAEH